MRSLNESAVARKDVYAKFLTFIASDTRISLDRLYALSAGTGGFCDLRFYLIHELHHFSDFHEARAILLGRLGRHDQALETYVYRLQDYSKAEE